MSRNAKIVTAIVAVVAVLAVGSIGYAQIADGSNTKKPLIILADVRRRTLQESASLSGTLARKELREVTSVSQSRVSAVYVKEGVKVPAGAALFALDGRDAIAVGGSTQFFRPLDVGDRGDDVLQLEQILVDAGYNPGPIDTVYTEQTRFALAQYQAQLHYPGATPVTAQSVSVSLTGSGGATGGSYQVGPKSSAGLIIGPGAPAHLSALRLPAERTISAVPSISIQSSGSVVTEGAVATFVIQASTTSASPIDVNLVQGGTATASDIVTPPTSVTLAAGTTATTVQVQTRADGIVEPNKSLTMSVIAGSNYSIGSPASASTTIVDANVPKLHLAGGGTVAAGGTATVTVVADQAPVTDTQVLLTIAGDAQPGRDFTSVNPALTLKAGHTSVSTKIATRVSDTIEPARHIVISLTQSTAFGTVSPSTAVVTIAADSSVPVVTLRSDVQYLVKGQPYPITIGLSRPIAEALPISLIYGGTARAGADYVPVSGVVTVPAGQTLLQLQIPTVSDNVVQSDRLLSVALGTSTRYVVGMPFAAGVTITSQVVPEISITASTDAVVAGGAATFTITADQAPVEDTTVNYQVVGTAQPGKDFEPLIGSVLLPAGQTAVTVTIRSISKDVVFQPNDLIVGDWPIRVGQVFVKEGDSVAPGAPIVSLVEPSFTVTLKATATDRTKLAVGQHCAVKLTGGDKEVDGTISQLDENVTVDDKTNEQSYQGEINVSDLGAADGASVSIDCTTKEKKATLTVPIAAVKQNGSGEDVVRAIDLSRGGKITEKKVTTGLSEGSYIEVSSGLEGNETVIVEVDQRK